MSEMIGGSRFGQCVELSIFLTLYMSNVETLMTLFSIERDIDLDTL